MYIDQLDWNRTRCAAHVLEGQILTHKLNCLQRRSWLSCRKLFFFGQNKTAFQVLLPPETFHSFPQQFISFHNARPFLRFASFKTNKSTSIVLKRTRLMSFSKGHFSCDFLFKRPFHADCSCWKEGQISEIMTSQSCLIQCL